MSIPIQMTEDQYLDYVLDERGICLACGEVGDAVEADVREFPCRACGQFQVISIEYAMLTGKIELTD